MIGFEQWLMDSGRVRQAAKALAGTKAAAIAEAVRRRSSGAGGHLLSKRERWPGQHRDGTRGNTPASIPEAAGDRLEAEQLREEHHDSLLAVDPYDVLACPSESGFKTPFERDDASNVNPQPRSS